MNGRRPLTHELSSPCLPRLALPIENLTEIFKLALDFPLEPSTPFMSPVSPYQEFASLLVASRTLRSLALPYVYRAIVIATPNHWAAFFGVGRGVFVAGYDVAAKRAALEHIYLVEQAAFPVDLGACARPWVTLSGAERSLVVSSGSGWQIDCLVPLVFAGVDVKSLTMVPLPMVMEDANHAERLGQDETDQLVEALVKDDVVCTHVESETEEDVEVYLEELVQSRCDALRGQAIVSFLRAIRPPSIMMANELSTFRLASHGAEVHRGTVKLIDFRPNGSRSNIRRRGDNVYVGDREDEFRRAFPGAVFEMANETATDTGGYIVNSAPGWPFGGWEFVSYVSY